MKGYDHGHTANVIKGPECTLKRPPTQLTNIISVSFFSFPLFRGRAAVPKLNLEPSNTSDTSTNLHA